MDNPHDLKEIVTDLAHVVKQVQMTLIKIEKDVDDTRRRLFFGNGEPPLRDRLRDCEREIQLLTSKIRHHVNSDKHEGAASILMDERLRKVETKMSMVWKIGSLIATLLATGVAGLFFQRLGG